MKRALVALLVLTFASVAGANGRFPRAQRLLESASDSNVLALYGTYGLLVSRDAGRSWNHICEAATGPYTGEDPLLELLPGDVILARTETALVTSEDTWCDWKTALDGTTDSIQDITRDPLLPRTVLALVGGFDVATGFVSRLLESPDGAASWAAARDLPRDQMARGLSLEVAPSATNRVLVSGLDQNGMGRLLVSDDRGASWAGRALGSTDSNSAPYLAQISKVDPDRFFVRTDTYREIDFIDTANDALLLSVDGGVSFTTLIERKAKLFGFALSPDESTLLVGYGDPMVAATYVEPSDLGIYRADMAQILANPADAEAAFVKIFDASVTCLRWTETALYACTSQSERGFEVGKALGAGFALADPRPFEPLLLLPEVTPLACGAGTDGYACYTDPDNGFGSVCGTFQASCDASPPPPPPPAGPDGGAPDSGTAGTSGGTGGAFSSGGSGPGAAGGAGSPPSPVGGNAGRPGADAGGVTSAAPASREASSCACRAIPVRGGSGFAIALAIAAAVLSFLRRR